MDLHLNKARKFFYFQTRIQSGQTTKGALWEAALLAISELQKESALEVFGLVLDTDCLQIVFSTPYFNENILVLDWEMRIKKRVSMAFERPVLCEPVNDEESAKRTLLEIYSEQINVQNGAIQWRSPYNSLKMLFEGDRQARLFNDLLKIVFQPSLILQFRKRFKKSSAW